MTYTRTTYCRAMAVALGIALAMGAGLLFDRRSVIDLDSTLSFIEPSPATPGKVVAITWHARARRICPGIVIPRFIDNSGRVYEYTRSPVVYHTLLASGKSFTKTLVLPEVMSPGPARYEAVVIRWCNFMQEFFWPMVDRPFPIYFVVK